MTTEEREVYSAYEGASQSDASRVSASQKLADEKQNVYASYVAINTAMIEKDRTAMDLYFDENLTFTHMSGKKQTREEFIGEIMDGTLNYFKVDTKDYSISVDGDTAHMKVTHILTAKVYGISGSWTLGGENTYKKRNGIWVRIKKKIIFHFQISAKVSKLNASNTCAKARRLYQHNLLPTDKNLQLPNSFLFPNKSELNHRIHKRVFRTTHSWRQENPLQSLLFYIV